MEFLVIGCGSIGRRHIKNLKELGHAVYSADLSAESRKKTEEELSIKTYPSVESALNNKPDGVLICTPPTSHLPLALLALEGGAHVFIEKPVSNSTKGISAVEKAAKKAGRVVQVGYNLRHSRVLRKTKELLDAGRIGKVLSARVIFANYLPYWRSGVDYRKTYSANREMGGGIILDASHELDYICWLLGRPKKLACLARKVSDLEIDVEDNADILLEFEGGSVANVHVDFIRKDYTRNCELHGEKGTLICNMDNKARRYSILFRTFDTREGRVLSETIADEQFEPNEMYIEELKSFLSAMHGEKVAFPGLRDGKLALEVALKALESSEKGKTIVFE